MTVACYLQNFTRTWIAAIYLLVIPSVNPQVAMYPMFPPPMQIAIPMPVPVPIMIGEQDTTRTTTTTTTESPERTRVGIAFPIPMPMPMSVPFAFPAFPAVSCQAKNRSKGCPPCPPCLCLPSCTPSFFSYCSPCHKKCRCRSKEDTPKPMRPRPPPPAMGQPFGVAVPVPPMFAPPPVVVVPFPPPRPPWRSRSSYSSSSSDCTYTDSTDDSSSSSNERRRKRRKKIGHIKRRPIYRRRFDSLEISDNELVKPVLTYLSQDGNVKLKRKLSNDEAAELMNDKPYQKIRVTAGEDDGNMPRILITSNNENNSGRARNHRRRQVVMSKGQVQHMLGEGRKELLFRPPGGKKISNLSVSFQISE